MTDQRTEDRQAESTGDLEDKLAESQVPPSERDKAEQMPMERRAPTGVFGLVAGSYLLILIVALVLIALIAAIVW
jgi:hypothetical protein